ncbi:MAG: sodium:solute symporter family protein [Candidatus Aminicenantes bacterium]|nr:MAG: sodium:solute symporter family protein [Candidatus Aminicenantes bacterium]
MLLSVVILYLLITVGISFYLSKRVKSTTDFLIAGRKLGLLLTTATLAAIQLGAGVILGGAELGAQSGIWPGMWYGIGCGGGLILAGLLVAAKLRRRGGYVPLDFFAARYGEKKWVRFWGWLSNIPSLLGIFVAQVMAAGTIFSLFGIDYKIGIIISGVVIMLYSVLGGMISVAVVNFVQLGIIVLGIPLVAVMSLNQSGSTFSDTAARTLSTPFIPSSMLSQAVFIIVPFLLAISVSYDAFMRYQSAKSERVAKWGCILGGIIVILISFCVGLVGASGKAIYPTLENAEILPKMIQTTLPPVLAGFVVSALLAAAMSTGNCLLISLAGCFSRDLYNKVLNPSAKLDELKYSKTISRIVVVGTLFVGVAIAFYAKGILYTIIIFNYPYMASLLVPLLGGVLWKGATTKGAIAALFAGGAIGVASFVAGIPGPLQGLFNIDLGLLAAYAVSTIVFVSVSLLTPDQGYRSTPKNYSV